MKRGFKDYHSARFGHVLRQCEPCGRAGSLNDEREIFFDALQVTRIAADFSCLNARTVRDS